MSLRQAIDLARHLGSAWFSRGQPGDAPAPAAAADPPDDAGPAVALADGARALALRVGERARAESPWRGFVESADPQRGISGWLADLRDPFAHPELELVIGERVVARWSASDVKLLEDGPIAEATVPDGAVMATAD